MHEFAFAHAIDFWTLFRYIVREVWIAGVMLPVPPV
jgi:hypothetical protein